MPSGIYIRIYKTPTGKESPNFRGGVSVCIDCNNKLKYRYSRKKETRCRECYLKFNKRENASNWKGGKGYPSCVNCNGKTGDCNSILCRKCYRGKLHPQYKGGISDIYALVRGLPENRQWQKQCLYRDNYCCFDCGIESKGNNLQIHHIKQFALIIKENNIKTLEEAKNCEELWDTDNGMTLCRDCHKLTDNYNKKLTYDVL